MEIQDLPERTNLSYQAQDTTDPEALGLEGLKRAKIDYIIIDPSLLAARGSTAWLKGLMASSQPVYQIIPQDDVIKGPELFIYQINKQ